MSEKNYSIFGINTELDLDKTKLEIMKSLKQAKVGSVADNAIYFDFGATGFIDIFPDHSEIRAEVQADNDEAELRAREIMQSHLFIVLNVDPAENTAEWKDITNAVLSDRARVTAEKAKNAAGKQE